MCLDPACRCDARILQRADHPRLPTLIKHHAFILILFIFILSASFASLTSPVHIIMPRTVNKSPSSAKKSKVTPVPLSEEEIDVLRSHLEEWNRNKGKARRRIKDAAIAEARFLAPKMDKKLLKLRPSVSVCGGNNQSFAELTGIIDRCTPLGSSTMAAASALNQTSTSGERNGPPAQSSSIRGRMRLWNSLAASLETGK